jgi:mannose-6-phosphate isomerase-like protein (cupin superfamily)
MTARAAVLSLASFRIEDMIRRGADAAFTREYNCNLRRLYPWSGRIDTKRQMTELGVIWIVVEARSVVDRHDHDEEESFVVISGRADFELEGQQTCLGSGDVAYVPRSWRHQIANPYDQDFVFLDIYWDLKNSGKSKAVLSKSAPALTSKRSL